MKELQRQASPNIVIALAGNKADLAGMDMKKKYQEFWTRIEFLICFNKVLTACFVGQRSVDFEEASAYAEENSLLFLETSAKTAMNVNDIFLAIAKKLPKNEPKPGPKAETVDVNAGDQTSSKGPCACK